MTISFIISMLSFCIVLSISPGPVNAMIVTSGLNNGFKKTFSFISGATIGFTLLLVVIAFTYESFFISANKKFLLILELISALFIIYIGYKIASSSIIDLDTKESKTLKFYEGFLLQWLNPKAWLACFAGVSMFVNSKETLILFILMYFIVCYVCLSLWGILGQKATIFFNTKFKIKVFNLLMGSILILSAVVLLLNNI